MFTFKPNHKLYRDQSNANYDQLIKKVRSMYCGIPVRVENGVVSTIPRANRRTSKVIGKIVKV